MSLAWPISTAAMCSRTKLRCVLLAPSFSQTFPPAPRTCSSAPYVARLLQWDGGGLYIVGTATLIDSNVYSNQAGVGARFEPS